MNYIVHGVPKSQTRLSCFHFTSHSLDVSLFVFVFFNIFKKLKLLVIADSHVVISGYKTYISEKYTLSSFAQWSCFVKL